MKKLYLNAFLLIISLSVFSQTVTIYDTYNATETVNIKNIKSSINNNLQWNFSLLDRGVFAFTYERKINQYLGLEAGLGATLFSDPFLYSLDDDWYNDYYFYTSDYYDETHKIGMFASISAKIYPKQMSDFEGFYFAPTFRYRTYGSEVTATDYYYDYNNFQDKEITDTYNQSTKVSDLAFIAGYQYEGWSEILWNFYAGLNWMNVWYDQIAFDELTNRHITRKAHSSGPSFLLGVTLGFSF